MCCVSSLCCVCTMAVPYRHNPVKGWVGCIMGFDPSIQVSLLVGCGKELPDLACTVYVPVLSIEGVPKILHH